MKDSILSFMRVIRAFIMVRLYPNSHYPLAVNKIEPLSTKFGYDRGTPIDRYWIESFVRSHKEDIHGICLEIGDDRYSKQFGNKNVKKIEILDINTNNKKATIHGDLRNLPHIKSNSFDTIILTHVLGMIDDIPSAIKEIHRILKPGGIVLATVACIAPVFEGNTGKWHIMPEGAKYLFETCFTKNNITVSTYGNVYSGQCFWVGMSQEELTHDELEYNDPRFPCITAVIAVKQL